VRQSTGGKRIPRLVIEREGRERLAGLLERRSARGMPTGVEEAGGLVEECGDRRALAISRDAQVIGSCFARHQARVLVSEGLCGDLQLTRPRRLRPRELVDDPRRGARLAQPVDPLGVLAPPVFSELLD